MIEIAAEEGYAAATIARVIAQAGVSRPSFYEHFAEKDDCFLAALADIQERLLTEIAQTVHSQPPERAAPAAVEALVAFADEQPAMGRLLMNETMAGGPRTLHARDQGTVEIAQIIEHAYQQVPARTAIPDLSAATLIGAVYRLLASRLRRGERALHVALDDLLRWIDSYEQPAGEHRWRTLTPVAPGARSPFLPPTPLRAPPALGPGRPRVSERAVAENHRQRILFATAEIVQKDGYIAATVAEIIKLAGVDGRVFYSLFADKQDAFMAVHELGFQHTMAVTAGAFFAGASWPQRIWEAGRAFTQYLEQNPTLTHASLIESHAGGPITVQRFEDLTSAFTIFLQEGYQYQPQSTPPPRLALEAIAAANFEIVYRQARKSTNPKMAGLLPHLTHICLAPFLGSTRANELIDEQMNTGGKSQVVSP